MASILIADDVALARDALARALRERGHRVAVVADGQEAIERFHRDRPELVILDVMMPRLGGLDACGRIKAAGGGFVPVLLISARADLDSRLAALAVAEDFISKPYDASEVCARVEAHLRTRRLFEEASARTSSSSMGSAAAGGAGSGGLPAIDRGEDSGVVQLSSDRSGSGKVSRTGSLSPRLLERDAFLERVQEEWRRSARTTDPITLLLAGVDGAAPPPGEQPVAILLAALQRSLRGIDVIARIDEEHAAALLLKTHITGSMAVATRLRADLRRNTWANGVTPVVSMGFGFYPNRDVAEPNDLLRVGEKALARAREEGPGRVCLWQHQGYLFDPPENP